MTVAALLLATSMAMRISAAARACSRPSLLWAMVETSWVAASLSEAMPDALAAMASTCAISASIDGWAAQTSAALLLAM